MPNKKKITRKILKTRISVILYIQNVKVRCQLALIKYFGIIMPTMMLLHITKYIKKNVSEQLLLQLKMNVTYTYHWPDAEAMVACGCVWLH